MRNLVLYLSSFLSCLLSFSQQSNPATHIQLPNGWSLSPVGKSVPLGDLPLNIAVSADKTKLAITNNGQSKQTIQLIDAVKEKLLSTVEIPKSWLGLKFSADGKFLYASGGNDNMILKYRIENNRLILADSIILGKKWPVKISPAGLELDNIKQRLYVVTKENNSLYTIDLKTNSVVKRDTLGAEAYTCLLSGDGLQLYISIWGADKILIYNTVEKRISDSISVGDNPNDLCLSRNGKYLFVANANDNSVSVIDTKKRIVLETLNAALYPNAIPGSTTNSVALSADEKILYVANADNNCLAVFNVTNPGSSRSMGFIPTGWYPTCVRTIGNKIYVANAKGYTSLPNRNAPGPYDSNTGITLHQGSLREVNNNQYIGGLFKGTLSIIKRPQPTLLNIYSSQVYQNTPYNKKKELISKGEKGNPIPMKIGEPSPIKHVFYIIKENRTYDQVLSDIPAGNGDTSLLLFGEKITPNQHAIAKEFILLDNFYVDAEVSADGHNWSMGAYATDYLEKTWPTNYGGRGGIYDGEGNRSIANNKGGFIWDHCARAV